MFIDWLSVYQDFAFELPIIADDGYCFFDFVEGSYGKIRQSRVKHEGSFSTSITVHVQGNRIVIEGNPSRFNRLDNLFGFSDIDDCFIVYNDILLSLGLPVLTKCRFLGYEERLQASGSFKLFPRSDGAIITRIDLTTNYAVGKGGCIFAYLKALSMMPFRRSRGKLYADGNTCEWKSILGNAREIYPSVYNKANEFVLHLLPKVKRTFGDNSSEYNYITQLINYCRELGVTRHEQKFKSTFLNKHNLQFYGLSDLNQLTDLHNEFLNIDQKLQVSAMDLRTINQTLLEKGICKGVRDSNASALYAINWMNGEKFDESKSQVKIHRARLRKIGIDILKPCNLLLFSPVIVKEVFEIHKTELQPPPFYIHAQLPQHPQPPLTPQPSNHLRLVA